MKKRAKKVLFPLLMLAVLFLTGCHGSTGRNAFDVPKELDETKIQEITFWAKNDTNKTQTKIYEKAIRDFESLYPNIKVTMRLYTDYGKIYNDVITNISTDTTPNVCITYPDHIATYKTGSNVVVPLDELMEDERFGLGGSELRFDSPKKEEMVEQFLIEGQIDGIQYAIPYMRSTECCYINQTMLKKLGYEVPDQLTWDFIWEVSEKAMEKNADGTFAVNGQKVLIPFIDKSTDNMLIQMLKQKGAPYSTEEGEILIFNDITKELLSEIAVHAKSGAFSTFKISSYPANFLNAGQCIFAIDSSAGATWMGCDAPLCDISPDKLVQFETAVRPVPQFDPDDPQMISQGPSVCVFNKADEQEVLASWLFAQYLLTNEVQIAYAKTEGYLPVTEKAQKSKEYQEYLEKEGEDTKEHYAVKLQASKILLENTDHTFVTPVFNGSASLRDAAGQMIENVTKSVRRKQTVDEAFFKKLYADITSLYHLDQLESGEDTEGPKDLGPLPVTAKVLLSSIAAAWILILLILGVQTIRRKRKKIMRR